MPNLQKSEKGFTITEVLIAILLIGMFTANAMSLVTIQVAWKVNNQRRYAAAAWIEEDQGKILEIADNLTFEESKCRDMSNSYAVELWRKIENENTIRASKFPGRNDLIILNDNGANYQLLLPVEKNLSPGGIYKLKRKYQITKQNYQILKINYEIVDENNKVIKEEEWLIKPNIYYQCSF